MAKKPRDFSKAFSDNQEFVPNHPAQQDFSSSGPNSDEQRFEDEIIAGTVELIELSRAKPDYNQPRAPLLPPQLHEKFWFGENIDCFRVAAEWLELANSDAAMAEEVNELLDMGGSFQEDGQVNPITGCWVEINSNFLFIIETGERRYWAAVLFSVIHNIPEPKIRATVVPTISRRRQIMENIHQSKPGPVSQAREIAICILEIRGQPSPYPYPDPYEFVRTVNDKQIKQSELRALEEMYQIRLTPQRINQILKILEFPTELLFIADHYRLSSRKLMEIFSAAPERWSTLIRQEAASHAALMEKAGLKITSETLDVSEADLAETQSPAALPSGQQTNRIRTLDRRADPAVKAMIGLRRFQKILFHSDETSRRQVIDQIADEIVVARDEGLALVEILEALTASARARFSRM